MAIGDDFAIDGSGNITHTSGATNYTVLALHRWLQDLADDPEASVGDLIDITTGTPSERSTDNIITLNSPFNINDTASQFLYDGSITQNGGNTIYAGLVVVGAVESGTQLQIWQDEAIYTSFWSTGFNADSPASILNRVLIKVRNNGADIDGRRLIVWSRELSDTYAEFSVTMGLGNNVAAIFTGPDLNNTTAAGTIAGWTEITNTEGYQLLDIAADGSANEPYYSQWDYGIRTASNVYERTKWIGRRGSSEAIHSTTGPLFRGITNEWAWNAWTADVTEDDVVAWGTSFGFDTGTGTAPAVGQYWSNSTAGGVGKVVYVTGTTSGVVVIQRETTTATWADDNVFALLGGTGAFLINVAGEAINGQTNAGGSGRILANVETVSNTSGTTWIQLLSGSAPANSYRVYQRGTAGIRYEVNGAATARTVSPEFLGTYTGSSIIGAFGVGVQDSPPDGIAADLFTTLTGSNVNPPNNQTFTVFGLLEDDRVLVTNNDAVNIDFDQFATNATYDGAGVTAIVTTTSIPLDTPVNGIIRIELDTGIYRRIPYTSWTGSTFTIGSTDFTDPLDATVGNNLFIGYIDKAADTLDPGPGEYYEFFTTKYISDRTLFIRVRDGGVTPIKTFQTTASFGSGGGSATAIRTSDA